MISLVTEIGRGYMHDGEVWQVYHDNGLPIQGKGATTEEFSQNPDLIMGNAHVWFWKKDSTGTHILLQKRAATKATKPDMYHISAGGHINVGESSIEAALRETKEEMGIDLLPDELHYVGSTRIVELSPNSIVHVFLYRLRGDENFTYLDGEVGSHEWRSLENFEEITKAADTHSLVNQGALYFGTLIDALKYVANENHKV